jgi:hypothetical protein
MQTLGGNNVLSFAAPLGPTDPNRYTQQFMVQRTSLANGVGNTLQQAPTTGCKIASNPPYPICYSSGAPQNNTRVITVLHKYLTGF